MKRLLPALVGIAISLTASGQKAAVKTDTISTPTIQCGMCEARLQEYLRRIDGVTFVKVNYKSKDPNARKVIVKYLKDRTNSEMIKASIANAGYDAGEIAANPDSYKMLPKCCRKP